MKTGDKVKVVSAREIDNFNADKIGEIGTITGCNKDIPNLFKFYDCSVKLENHEEEDFAFYYDELELIENGTE